MFIRDSQPVIELRTDPMWYTIKSVQSAKPEVLFQCINQIPNWYAATENTWSNNGDFGDFAVVRTEIPPGMGVLIEDMMYRDGKMWLRVVLYGYHSPDDLRLAEEEDFRFSEWFRQAMTESNNIYG